MYCCKMNSFDTRGDTKPTFWINKPHEGPDKYEFDFMCVDFSDGVKRFICKSEIVPEDYWPDCVYQLNTVTETYDIVGRYKKDKGNNIYTFICFD